MPKTWIQKFNNGREPEVEILEKPFGGMMPGDKMLIASPKVVEEYLFGLKKKQTRTVAEMREDLAKQFKANGTCPLTASIFLRIVAEVNLERMASGEKPSKIAPFWRVIDEKSPIAKKLSCGPEKIAELRKEEGIGRQN